MQPPRPFRLSTPPPRLRRWRSVYSRFVHRHGLARHFRRRALWETFAPHEVAAHTMPAALGARLLQAADAEPAALLARLKSGPAGLDAAHATRLLRRLGPNEPAHEQRVPAWRHLWHCYANPFSLLLTLLAGVSWLGGDGRAAVVIGAMVALSTALRFVQEARSGHAADALKALVAHHASVRRPTPGEPAPWREEDVPVSRLVPGDVVQLAAGDLVPADLRLLTAKDLFVSQSAMTGEALPVEKHAASGKASSSDEALARANLLFMGTSVTSGTATAVVVETGPRTYFGALAQSLGDGVRAPTAFQAGVNHVSALLLRFMAVMAPLVLLLNGATKGNWLEALLFALSIAVGLTPELLPMIVTATLVNGAVVLSRQRVIVKRLDAIQNFGAMNVLCTDKTGTLTQDHIVLERHADAAGRPSPAVLQLAWLNSHFQTGLKNLLDVAVLQHAEVPAALDGAAGHAKVDEIPFDFERRRLSVVVAAPDGTRTLICKGAVAEVLACCSHVRVNGRPEPLDAAQRAATDAVTAAWADEGLRVVAVATKAVSLTQATFGVADETGLTLAGYVAFLDPPKESTAPALRALAAHGIAVKILTGDHDRVALKVCHDVGLLVQGVLTGPQVAALDEPALAEAARHTTLFARLDPAQKARIVQALRAHGDVVGYLGDGINDAPALRAADIGISVDSAVDIARESADIILLDKSLLVLQQGVVAGRRNFANLQKYLRMTTSSNFGNVLSVLVASVSLPFLPMRPLQLLTQNLLYDTAQIALPFDHVDAEVLQRPQAWRPEDVGRFMLWFGPVSSLFDLATFALMWWVFQATTPAQQALFQSGWFVEGLLSQALIVHLLRTRHLPFLQSRAAWPLTAATAAVMAAGISLVMSPLAPAFGLQALPPLYFAALTAILVAYIALAQGVKHLYTQRHGWD